VVREFAQQILNNAVASNEAKQEALKDGSAKEGSPSKSASEVLNDASRSEATVGSKRSRDGELNGLPITKRTVNPSNSKPAVGCC